MTSRYSVAVDPRTRRGSRPPAFRAPEIGAFDSGGHGAAPDEAPTASRPDGHGRCAPGCLAVAARTAVRRPPAHRRPGEGGAGLPPLVVVAHGTRLPAGSAAVDAVVAAVRDRLSGTPVHVAHIDVDRPLLPQVLAGLSGPAVVVPLLLGAGYHVRVDIPRAVAAAPWVRARIAPALGPDPALAAVLADRLAAAGFRPGDHVVLAAAGSSDPRANAAAQETAALLTRRLGPVLPRPVTTAYVAGPAPNLAEAVAARRSHGRRVAVATYLIAPGRFATATARCGADVVAEPLGAHPAVAGLVVSRYHRARAALAAPRDAAHP